jgi:predicted RNase H-like HicB family nuclease
MEYTISIETNDDGWLTGQCEQLPQAISQGENLEDLMENMQDAIEFVLDYQRDTFRKQHRSNCVVEALTI